MRATENRLAAAWWVLRIVLGTGLFLAGLDKFFDVLANWSMYLSPLAGRLLPLAEPVLLRVVGILEMVLGLGILTHWTRTASYLMAAWLLAIAINLAITGNFWDLVLRDVEIATSAFVLGRLTAWRREAALAESHQSEAFSDGGVVTRKLEGGPRTRPA